MSQSICSAQVPSTAFGDTVDQPEEAHRPVQGRKDDPLRRFTATPLKSIFPMMGRTLHLETNDAEILTGVLDLFSVYPGLEDSHPQFTWKIVSEADIGVSPPWPKRHAFSDDVLRFVEFGQRTFIAVDLDAREAIAFIPAALRADKVGFTIPFLDTLFCMIASSLGVTALHANCVATGDKGVLVFGNPNSGKTTASYLATKSGLEFYADEGVFAELHNGGIRVWGGFWPAVFRPDSLQFYPELRDRTRPLRYCQSVFHHLVRHKHEAASKQPVLPLACVFLERCSSGSPTLLQIERTEMHRLLFDTLLFKEDDRYREQWAEVLAYLAQLPAYRFVYPGDPALAADLFRQLLR